MRYRENDRREAYSGDIIEIYFRIKTFLIIQQVFPQACTQLLWVSLDFSQQKDRSLFALTQYAAFFHRLLWKRSLKASQEVFAHMASAIVGIFLCQNFTRAARSLTN